MSDRADSIYDTARTKKGFRSRQAILAHTSQLLGDFGPAAVTVSGICEAAKISRSAFYNYFTSAEDAVDVMAKNFAENITKQFAKLHQDHPRGIERLAYCLRFIQETATQDPEWGKLIVQIQQVSPDVEAKLVEQINEEVKAARKTGTITLSTGQVSAFMSMTIATLFRNCQSLALGSASRDVITPSIHLLLRAAGAEETTAKKAAALPLRTGALSS